MTTGRLVNALTGKVKFYFIWTITRLYVHVTAGKSSPRVISEWAP